MCGTRETAVSQIVCDETRKIRAFVGLEPQPHTFFYPGRYPKPVRVEETSNSCLASECIITDANSTTKRELCVLDWCILRIHSDFTFTSISS